MKDYIAAYFHQQKRTSLLWVVLLNQFVWTLILALHRSPNELQGSMTLLWAIVDLLNEKLKINMDPDMFYAVIFAGTALFAIVAHSIKCSRTWPRSLGNMGLCVTNLVFTVFILSNRWPEIPFAVPGMIAVTVASIVLYTTTPTNKQDGS